MPRFVPVAGLPRSGSTLLCRLLAQNPAFFSTPTSGVYGLVEAVRTTWGTLEPFRAQGLQFVRPRVLRAIRGLITEFHGEAYADGAEVVFNKNRGWPQLLEVLEQAFDEHIHVLYPVRDIRDVVASFERLHRKDMLLKNGPTAMTVVDRAEGWLAVPNAKRGIPGGAIGAALAVYHDAANRGMHDRILRVPFTELTRRPQEVLDAVHGRLGLEPFKYDPENVSTENLENDEVYGIIGLHETRARVAPVRTHWADVLPAAYGEELAKRYPEFVTHV